MPPEGVIVRRSAPQHDERTIPAALARFSMRSRRLWCVLAATVAAAGLIVPVASGANDDRLSRPDVDCLRAIVDVAVLP